MIPLLLSALLAAPGGEPAASWLESDPYVAPFFGELAVRGPDGERMVPALVQRVDGKVDGRPFVNLLRQVDARPLRGKLVALRQTARLQSAAADTSVRLWARTRLADGRVGFDDDGRDRRARSVEDTRLESVLAIAPDATDLAFGLVVEGSQTVLVGEFELEILGEAAVGDLRHEVPARFVEQLAGRHGWVADPASALDLHWTLFVPEGVALDTLPLLVAVADAPGPGAAFRVGRAALARMRAGRDPDVALALVEPSRPAAPEELLAALRRGFESRLLPACAAALGRAESPPVTLVAARGAGLASLLESSGLAGAASIERAEDERALRVALRRARAEADAGGDAALAALLFETGTIELDAEAERARVEQASHALDGHQCDHDHPHDHHR